MTEFRKEQKAWNKGINCPQVTGSKNGNWKGGKNKHSKGYIEVRVAVNRRKLEHRKIMEDYLGRELKSSEIIHHKDGNKTNNSIENLIITNSSDHAKYHLEERNFNASK